MSSQSGSSEVSKKLKAAIRAKLEELGVYVDDELPDYIMVMIANKKEKAQMKDDLSLFIGKSTAKFVDWLFDLFDRLQNASSKPGESTSKKEEDKSKETAAKEQEEKQRKEKETKDRELQAEKERERERQKERDREKRAEDEKRRERDDKRKELQKNKRRRSRSRSNTYSDDEDRSRAREKFDRRHRDRDNRTRSPERKRVASTVVHHHTASPERKVQSTVTVKRNIRPSGDSSNVKARGTMFLRAMNEASVSAGYGSSKKEGNEDDWSDVEALPSKVQDSPQKVGSPNKTISPKKSIRDRLTRVAKEGPELIEDDDAVVLGNQPQTGGPQMIVKLSGGKEAIKRTRIQDRIVVVDNNMRRGLLKRKAEAVDEPKSKHERIIFDITAESRDTTPTDDSPTMQKWNGQIRLEDDSDSEDEEAEIDAFVAEARGINRKESVREEEDELPPTHQLSGKSYTIHVNQHYQQQAPTYIPTPLSVLQEQQNQLTNGGNNGEISFKEKCLFWPRCAKGEACPYMHPSKTCSNFPNCTYGNRCLFIHPPCRFDRFCTKKHCPFTHQGTGGIQPGIAAAESKNPLTSNRIPPTITETTSVQKRSPDEPPKPLVRGALGSLAEKLAATITKKSSPGEKKDEKDENEKESSPESKKESAPSNGSNSIQPSLNASPVKSATKKPLPEIAPLQNMILCRYAGGCRNPVCHFKHPKECRFGANCRNATCYFYHKPAASAAPAPIAGDSAAAAKYRWTASSST